MAKRVFVTGLGIISGLGKGLDANINSLDNCISGVGRMKFLDSIHRDIPVSEVKFSDTELIDMLPSVNKTGLSRTSVLGLLAAREAYDSALFDDYSCKTGFFNGTTVGGMDKTEKYYYSFLNSYEHKEYILSHDCGDSSERIARYLNIKDALFTISTACSSSANSIIQAAELIKAGKIERAIAGGTDSLSKFTLNGFNTLLILDREHCKPFDRNRKGLNLGEGAAFLALESEEIVKKENKKVLAELKGFGNANDAYHQTASSPDGNGAYLAMSKALTRASLKPEEIDYINAHGTATQNNDLSEGLAIQNLFNDCIPAISSTKPFTGHTLGAAGAIEAVISVISILKQRVYPNLNFSESIDELRFKPVTDITDIKIENILSNSFGFGGNNSSLIFSRVDQ